ncbi:MAG: DNA-3-methyladenine glycosylase [Actinobacteria bacterium]|nr:DNA-3-methyladenine glycosylase [Actinomycetota bacterium]
MGGDEARVGVSGYDQLHPRRAPLSRADLAVHPTRAAPRLLGALLVRIEDDGSETLARIVETEAYRETDPASHSYRGETPRTRTMFGPPGHLYVYFTYGMHHCVNVSCEPRGTGSAVLLRAAVAISGVEAIRERRQPDRPDRELLRGPGSLARGLGLDRELDGTDLLEADAPVRLERDAWRPTRVRVRQGPRTGVRHAPDRRWRWWLDGVPEVSRYLRHPGAVSSG